MKDIIEKLVKDKISDDIVAQLLKILDDAQGQLFTANFTLVFNVGKEMIEGEIGNSSVKIHKPFRKLNSRMLKSVEEKIISLEVFDSILQDIDLKANENKKEEFKRLLSYFKVNFDVHFPAPEYGSNLNKLLVSDYNNIGILNLFFAKNNIPYCVRNAGKKRVFALYNKSIT